MRFRPARVYYGWYVLAAVSSLKFANGVSAIAVLTVFILPLSDEFGWTRTQIAAATSIGALLGALTAPFAGRLTDTLGARLPLTVGSLCIVCATVALANMQSLLGFYLAFGLARLADQGLIQAPAPPTIGKWFRRYRGRAMAILSLASSIGTAVMPLLVHLMIQARYWRTAWLVLGTIMFGLGFLPCVVLVRRQPEDVGLSIDGIPQQRLAGTEHGSTVASAADDELPWSLGEAARTASLWLILAAIFMLGIGAPGVGLHLVPYLHQQGIEPVVAVGAVSLSFLAAGIGNLAWGYSADRWSVRYLLTATCGLRAVSLVVLLGTDTPFMATMFALLHGFAEGGQQTLAAVLLAVYYGRQSLGVIYGLLRAVQVIGFALGPVMAGRAFDVVGSYRGAFRVFLMLSIIGTLLIALAKPPRKPPA